MIAEGGHFGENIFGILHEHYPIDSTNEIKAFFSGLSYKSKTPFSTEMIFTKEKPDIKILNNNINQIKLASRQFNIK